MLLRGPKRSSGRNLATIGPLLVDTTETLALQNIMVLAAGADQNAVLTHECHRHEYTAREHGTNRAGEYGTHSVLDGDATFSMQPNRRDSA